MVILSGSIRTEPATPFGAAADSEPPANSTVPTAENSTKPPSPEAPPSARKTESAPNIAVSSAKMMTSPPSEFAPTPEAEIIAPAPVVMVPPARISTSPAFWLALPSALMAPVILMFVVADRVTDGAVDKSTLTASILTNWPALICAAAPVVTAPDTFIAPACMSTDRMAFTVPRTAIKPSRDKGTPLLVIWLNWVGLITPGAENMLRMKSGVGVET